MRRLTSFVLFFTFICYADQLTDERPPLHQQASTPLNGKHLRLIADSPSLPGVYDVKRNSTGHVVQYLGPIPHAVEWLSRRYNFTYSYVPITDPNMIVEDLPNQRGGITFLLQGEAELYLGAFVATSQRFKDADLSSAWLSGSYGILIPIPSSSTNIGALIEPMSTEVWICIVLSIPTIMTSLFGLSKCIVALNKRLGSNESKNNYGGNFQITEYVISVLLSQGGYCVRKQLAIRLAAAAWCLACFVLVQAYSSTLISFLTLPNNKPIINSVYDIPNVPGLKITVNRNYGADLRLQQTNSSFLKKLADSLREDPSLRCNKTETCLDKVRSGNHVYIHGEMVLQKIITADREKTGTCHFTMASESFWPGYLYFFLPKNSPNTETINRGILRMQETGLLGKWLETFNPVTTVCLSKDNKKKTGNSQITLKNFTSAFGLLIFGFCVSFLVFIVELIIYRLFGLESSCAAYPFVRHLTDRLLQNELQSVTHTGYKTAYNK